MKQQISFISSAVYKPRHRSTSLLWMIFALGVSSCMNDESSRLNLRLENVTERQISGVTVESPEREFILPAIRAHSQREFNIELRGEGPVKLRVNIEGSTLEKIIYYTSPSWDSLCDTQINLESISAICSPTEPE